MSFTEYVQRHVSCPPCEVGGATVREVLDGVFRENRNARGYFLDERGRLRPHVTVYVNGQPITDREQLSDEVDGDDEVYVMQALSGG